jgi:hypothetical protein
MSRLWLVAPRRSGFFGRHIAFGPPSADAREQSRLFAAEVSKGVSIGKRPNDEGHSKEGDKSDDETQDRDT